MKLISTIIRNYSDLFIEEIFNFTNEYLISYDFNSSVININKNVNYIPNSYGNTIYNITPIVGKNGCGKTSLLNIIGYTADDRIAHSSIDSNYNLKDSYFLLFCVDENLFYIESVNLIPQNIDNLICSSKFSSYYINKSNDTYSKLDYSTDTNEKIYYINNNYNISTKDQHTLFRSELRENLFIPRITNNISSLDEIYNAYLALRNKNMIFSDLIIEFNKNDNFIYEDTFFSIPPTRDEQLHDIDNYLAFIPENIDDFFRHYFSCIIGFYIRFFRKNEFNSDSLSLRFKSLNKSCLEEPRFSKALYKKHFKKLYNIVEKEAPNEYLLKSYTIHISKLFLSLYSIKQHIKPGYKYFKILFPNSPKNNQFHRFLKCYDKFNAFLLLKESEYNYNHNFSLLSEDYVYDKDEFDIKHIVEEKFFLPESLFTINNFLLSTGEKNILTLISELTYELKRFALQQPIFTWQQNKTFLVLVDEIETSMHLDWSRQFINFLVEYLDSQTFNAPNTPSFFSDGNYNIQLIFSTHSPFMLSDIVNNSTIALKRLSNHTSSQEILTTFAQNIQVIMHNSLFIDDCFGEYAKSKLDFLLKMLSPDIETPDELKQMIIYLIGQVGEPIIKKKLLDMYSKKYFDNSLSQEQQDLINNIQILYGEFNETTVKKIKDLFSNI